MLKQINTPERFAELSGMYYAGDYGAVGNGTTNDAGAIQAALDAAAAASGGIVLLDALTYRLGATLVIKTGVTLRGQGPGVTTLKLLNSIDEPVIETLNFDTFTGTGNGNTAPHSFCVENLTIDGNKANQTTDSDGLRLYGSAFRLRNLEIVNCKWDGLRTEFSRTGGNLDVVDGGDMFASVDDVVIHECGNYGVRNLGPHDAIYRNCKVYDNGRGINQAVNGFGTTYIGCHSWGASQDYAWKMDDHAILVGCMGEGASVAQLYLAGNNSTVDGGMFFGIPAHGTTDVGVMLAASGLMVNTLVYSTAGGVVDITNDGGFSHIVIRGYMTSGTPIVGTAHTSSSYQIQVQGGATNGTLFRAPPATSTPLLLKAGAPGDSDFSNVANGMLALDTTNHRLYIRSGGSWKYAALT